MNDLTTRIEGRAGRITFTRPKALNALSPDMSVAIERALDAWRDDPQVAIIVIDAEGERAFCAGGDVADIYHHGRAGDTEFGRTFWRQEYRMNAKLASYPKPVAAFMQGFTMGGGVGVGCHVAHRTVCESSQIAMPECGIGLIPDVGGTLLLARAPGRMGEYLGLTAARMGAGDAIHAGFADHFIAQEAWPNLIAHLSATGEIGLIADAARPAPASDLARLQPQIDAAFSGATLADILGAVDASTDAAFAEATQKPLRRNAPLAMGCTLEMIRRARGFDSVEQALELEFRYTARAQEQGDFLEGVRAQIIDKDRNPTWAHSAPPTAAEIDKMLAPLGDAALNLHGELT